MNLALDILSEELSEALNCQVGVINRNCPELRCVMLNYSGCRTEEGVCYISGNVPDISADSSHKVLFVLCGKISNYEIDGLSCSIIHFSNPQAIEYVFNTVQRIFYKYRQWEESLQNILYSTGSIQEMISKSVDVFQNLLAGNDSSYRIAFFDAPTPSADELPSTDAMDEFMQEIINDFQWDPNSRIPIYREVPGYRPNIALNLFEHEQYLGSISITQSHGPLRMYDGYLLEKLGEFIRKAILLYRYDDLRGQDQLGKILADIIYGNDVDVHDLSIIARFSGIDETATFRCISVYLDRPTAEEYNRFFFRRMSVKLPCMYIPLKGNYAIAILKEGQSDREGIDMIDELRKYLKKQQLQVGISERYHNLIHTKAYYQQSVAALKTAGKHAISDPIVLFEDCWMDYVLDNCTGELPTDMLYPLGFRRLVEHDLKGRVSYIETLEAYLTNNMNAKQASAALNISRNSFLSRLERLEKLLDLDLGDPQLRFYLMLCLYLRQHGN